MRGFTYFWEGDEGKVLAFYEKYIFRGLVFSYATAMVQISIICTVFGEQKCTARNGKCCNLGTSVGDIYKISSSYMDVSRRHRSTRSALHIWMSPTEVYGELDLF